VTASWVKPPSGVSFHSESVIDSRGGVPPAQVVPAFDPLKDRCRAFAALAAVRMVDANYRGKMKEMESKLSQLLEAWVSGCVTKEELTEGAKRVIEIVRASVASP
jgi:hypothetical protein